jgi:outer membrane autotransporter protein
LKAGDASFIAGSNLLVNEGGLLNLQGASKIADNSKIIVTLDKDALKEKKGETKIIQAGGSANVTLANITVINSNKWVKDTILGKDVSGKSSTDTATINSVWIQRDLNGALIKTDLTDMIASGSLTSSSKQIADQLVLMNLENSTGDARAFFMGAEGDKKAAIESLKPKSTSLPQAEILQVQQAAMSTVSSVLNERMAVGASDDLKAKAGIWVRGTYGKGKRQASSDYSTSAYNTEIGAGTIGVEAVIGENAVIGVAGTYAQTTIDYKDARDGDQDIFKSMIGSIYGAGTLSNNVVLNGSLIFANSDIEGKVKDLKDTDTAKDPKISAVSYGGTALIGYKVDMSGFSVTPLIGARFGVYTDPARKTGGGFANANEFTDTRVDVAFGLSASGEVKASDMVLVPELHTFGYYNVKGDKATRSVTLEGLPGDSTLTYDDKISKFQVNVGTSLTAKVGMVDYGAGVDGIFEDKSWFVQGAIKLRVSL